MDSELRRLMLSLDDPANDEASKDRYVALVAASLVEAGLGELIARRLGVGLDDPSLKKALASFDSRIRKARDLDLVSGAEMLELNRIREIRNTFAHAPTPVSFSTPELEEMTRRFWHYPVRSFSGYFAPAFSTRHRFAIVCAEFHSHLASL